MLIASELRQGVFDEDKGARIGELGLATETYLSKGGYVLDQSLGTIVDSRPTNFYENDDFADLYINPRLRGIPEIDKYAKVSVKMTGLPQTEEETDTASAWRHYMLWRDRERIWARPYLGTYPVMGGLCGEWVYGTTTLTYPGSCGQNFIENRGFAGESLSLTNWSYYKLKFNVTKYHPVSGTEVINTAEIPGGQSIRIDPDDEYDYRVIEKIEIDDTSPGLPTEDMALPFFYVFFSDPTLQNPTVKDPQFG